MQAAFAEKDNSQIFSFTNKTELYFKSWHAQVLPDAGLGPGRLDITNCSAMSV
jgi:hypothetical protein